MTKNCDTNPLNIDKTDPKGLKNVYELTKKEKESNTMEVTANGNPYSFWLKRSNICSETEDNNKLIHIILVPR